MGNFAFWTATACWLAAAVFLYFDVLGAFFPAIIGAAVWTGIYIAEKGDEDQ